MSRPKRTVTPASPVLLVVILCCVGLAVLSLILAFGVSISKSDSPTPYLWAAVMFMALALVGCGVSIKSVLLPWLKG